MSNEMNKFSYWLMQQLNEKNITQSQLARETGLTRQAINYFIKGEGKRPEDESLRLIAKALKVSIDEIYRGAGILPPIDEKSKIYEDINYLISELPEEDKIDVREYILHRLALAEKRGKSDIKQRRIAATKP